MNAIKYRYVFINISFILTINSEIEEISKKLICIYYTFCLKNFKQICTFN